LDKPLNKYICLLLKKYTSAQVLNLEWITIING